MKKAVLCTATCGAVIALAAAAGTGASSSARPLLGVADENPLVIRGTGFKANERVIVYLQAEERWTRRIEATPSGSFSVRFPTVMPARRALTAHAFGSRGSRARLLPARVVHRADLPGLPQR